MNKKHLFIILNALSLTHSLPQEAWSNIDSYLPLIEHMSSVSKLHKAAAEDAVIEKISTTQLMQKEDLYEINKKSGKLIADCILKNTKVVDRKILGLGYFRNVLYYRPTVTLDQFRDILEQKKHGIRYFDKTRRGIQPNDIECQWVINNVRLFGNFRIDFWNIFIKYAHFIEHLQGNTFPNNLCAISEHLGEYTELIKILGECDIKPELSPNMPLIKQIAISSIKDEILTFIIVKIASSLLKNSNKEASFSMHFMVEISSFIGKHSPTPGRFQKIGIYFYSLIASCFPISIYSLLLCCTR